MMITAIDRWEAASANIAEEIKRVSKKHGYASKKSIALVRAERLFKQIHETTLHTSWNSAMSIMRDHQSAYKPKSADFKAFGRVISIMEEFQTAW